jgi:hypothetical protein
MDIVSGANLRGRMNLTTNDAYDRVKLSLSRLNREWSLTTETLSPQADTILRRDMPDDNLVAGVSDLAEAYAHMTMAAARFLDPSSGPYDAHGDAHIIQRWNVYFGAAGDMLMFDMIDALDERAKQKVMQRFNSALSNASSMIQLIG